MGLERGHPRYHLQACTNGSLSIIFVGLRIAEVDEHPVAHVLRHEPAEALHGLGDAFLIGRNDLSQVLRIHAGGKCRRAYEVRKHHRHLAALGTILWLGAWGTRCGRRVNGGRLTALAVAQGSDGVEQLQPMPDCRDPQLLQGLVRQARENRLVYLILAECSLILPEAQAPQPIPEVHDSALNSLPFMII